MGELTDHCTHGGCASKISPDRLEEVLDGESLRGLRWIGDAVAFESGGSRFVGSVDFGTPVVDDPGIWSEIALANALSDLYAVGGVPIVAMVILGWPNSLGTDIARSAIESATFQLRKLGIVPGGGHTISSEEPFLGFAVVGTASDRPMAINRFAVGDALVLTKALGTGLIISADKLGASVGAGVELAAIQSMRTLNDVASARARLSGLVAATDVSGYGLLGACWDIARAASAEVSILRSAVPFLPGVRDLVDSGLLPSRAEETWRWLDRSGALQSPRDVPNEMLLSSPETSGGLLLGVPEPARPGLLRSLASAGIDAATVGVVQAGSPTLRLSD
jgi:selenide,water dikinase